MSPKKRKKHYTPIKISIHRFTDWSLAFTAEKQLTNTYVTSNIYSNHVFKLTDTKEGLVMDIVYDLKC